MKTEKQCDKCEFFDVCIQRLDAQGSIKFNDWDSSGGSDWLARLWTVIAERCTKFKPINPNP